MKSSLEFLETIAKTQSVSQKKLSNRKSKSILSISVQLQKKPKTRWSPKKHKPKRPTGKYASASDKKRKRKKYQVRVPTGDAKSQIPEWRQWYRQNGRRICPFGLWQGIENRRQDSGPCFFDEKFGEEETINNGEIGYEKKLNSSFTVRRPNRNFRPRYVWVAYHTFES